MKHLKSNELLGGNKLIDEFFKIKLKQLTKEFNDIGIDSPIKVTYAYTNRREDGKGKPTISLVFHAEYVGDYQWKCDGCKDVFDEAVHKMIIEGSITYKYCKDCTKEL